MAILTLQETAQILGGIGVIASVTYAAIQLRNNARAVRAASVQQLNLSIMSQLDELARNREFLTTVLKGGDNFEQLDRWDKARVRYFFLARMQRYEVAHFQHLVGNITEKDWRNIFEPVQRSITVPGYRTVWGLIRDQIGTEFRIIIDGLVEIENQKANAAAAAQVPAPPAKPSRRKARH